MTRAAVLWVAWAVATAGVGCREAPVVDVRLLVLGDVELGPRARMLVRRADGRVVLDSGAVAASELASGDHFDGSVLVEGERYIVDVIADASAGSCTIGTGRLVGRSLPFLHDEDGEDVYVHVGCGDALGPTGSMLGARVMHTAVTTAEGDVIIAGGSEQVILRPMSSEPLSVARFLTSVDRYDVETGRFEEVDLPVEPTPRLLPAGLRLADDSIVAIGGIVGSPDTFECHDSYEIVWPKERVTEPRMLRSPRCLPAAAQLDSAVVIAGSSNSMVPLTLEVHDPAMDAAPEPQPLPVEPSPWTALLETPHGALLVGAAAAPGTATVSDVRSDADTLTVTPFPPAWAPSLPPVGWNDFATVYVPCDAAGDRLGSVYLTGGGLADEAPTSDVAWCIPVTAAGYGEPAQFDGALHGARRGHSTVLVPGRAGPRLLVVPAASASEGDLLAITGCACAPPGTRDGEEERQSIVFPEPPSPNPVTYQGATATPLGDGSVLITGMGLSLDAFADIDPDDGVVALEVVVQLIGTRNAYLFVPDAIPEAIE